MSSRSAAFVLFALSLMVATPAVMAAELPVKAPFYKAQPRFEPYPTWTGFYAGFNAGYGFGSATATLQPTVNLFNIFSDGGIPGTAKLSPAGFIGGIQGGYNYQIKSWVLGAEVDFQYSSVKDNFSVSLPGSAFVGATTTIQQKMDWLSTARLRVGYLLGDTVLVYGTGGLAIAKISEQASFALNNGDSIAGSISDTRTGWAAGAGAEWAFLHRWTVRAEYLHYDLGSVLINMKAVVSPFPRGATVSNTVAGDLVRVGVNYRF